MEDMKKPLISPVTGQSASEKLQDGQRSILVFQEDIESETVTAAEQRTQRAGLYPPNIIVSSRYNLLNFLPKSLLEQFRRLANVYFLVIGIIALIGQYTAVYQSAIEPAGILAPMMIVVFISVIKDGVEDVKRHQQDNEINNRVARRVLADGTMQEVAWRDILVGDSLVVFADEELPADCVVVRAGGIQGSCCYVETAAIDGETNLKLKLPASSMSAHTERGVVSINSDKTRFSGNLDLLKCKIIAEAPNSSIHRFNAFVELPSASASHENRVALSEKSLLLRGSILRATEWSVCAVVYTGAHTKLSLNSKRPPSKLSSVDRIVNKTLLVAISTMIVVCCISMIFGVIWQNEDSNASYLCLQKNDLSESYPHGGGCESSAPSSFLNFFTFATLYNNFVCISMYVSLEMVYLAQSFFVSNDLTLYDETTDTPAECHTSGMCADLGQVQYVLSDKTGTLTKNQMVVQQLSVGKHIFGEPLTMSSEHTHTAPSHNIKPYTHTTQPTEMLERTSRLSLLDVELSDDTDAALLTEETSFHPALTLVQSVFGTLSDSPHNAHTQHTHASHHTHTTFSHPNPSPDRVLNFLRVLLYCNTAMLMPDATGVQETHSLSELQTRLQAESPDEVALVLSAAQHCGVLLERRSNREIVSRGLDRYRSLSQGTGVSAAPLSLTHTQQNTHTNTQSSNRESEQQEQESVCFLGESETVELLAVNEFDSDRKMMSVVIRVPQTNKTYLLCKGADSSVLARISSNKSSVEETRLCQAHIDYFANTGLRTLALACRELSQDEVLQWTTEYLAAYNALSGRSEALTKVALKIERDMELLGVVGIEDELQDGVAESISLLNSAGLNVWMITGDKAETAVAIAKKCALIRPHFSELERIVNLSDAALQARIEAVIALVEKKKEIVEKDPTSTALSCLTLIIDGLSLEGIWSSPTLLSSFNTLIQCVSTVIACRVSPLQKAALVRMVKNAPGAPVTLGIGDGANDVGMIHESRVGVGISGNEGRHAANAADFAIAQFRFIVPLLLEHGRFNYIRCSNLVLYSFFKNLLLVSVLFYYCTYSGFSGTIPLDSIVFSGYNFYLGLPILVLGATDFDIPRESVYKFPKEAYSTGRLGELLNLKNMAKWCIFAFVQGLLLFVVAIRFISGPTTVDSDAGHFEFSIYGTGLNSVSSGSSLGIFSAGFVLYTTCVVAMQYKVVSMFKAPNLIFWAMWLLSFAGYLLFTYLYSLFPTLNWYNAVASTMHTPQFWLAVAIVPLLLVISDHVFEQVNAVLDPSSRDILVHKLALDARPESRGSDATSGGGNGLCLRPLSSANHSSASATPTVSPLAPKGELAV